VWVGRLVKQEEIEHTPGGVLKDMNYSGRKMYLGEEQKKAFGVQIRRDCAFLVKSDIMDQSLLLGVHMPLMASVEVPPATTTAEEKKNTPTPITTADLSRPLLPSGSPQGELVSVFQNHLGGTVFAPCFQSFSSVLTFCVCSLVSGIRAYSNTPTGPVLRKEIYFMVCSKTSEMPTKKRSS
jgi:hypothetical protein